MENIEDFKRLGEIHCKNEDEMKEMTELRRKIKNRVSQFSKLSSALRLKYFFSVHFILKIVCFFVLIFVPFSPYFCLLDLIFIFATMEFTKTFEVLNDFQY